MQAHNERLLKQQEVLQVGTWGCADTRAGGHVRVVRVQVSLSGYLWLQEVLQVGQSVRAHMWRCVGAVGVRIG